VATRSAAIAIGRRVARYLSSLVHMQEITIRGQLVQKTEWKRTDGRTRPIALPSPLTRSVTSYRSGGGETICPAPTAVRLAADVRPFADESAVRTSLVAGKLQAASVPIEYSLGWNRQKGGRNAVSLNAPLRRGITNIARNVRRILVRGSMPPCRLRRRKF